MAKDNIMERKTIAEWNQAQYEKLPKANLLCGMPLRKPPTHFEGTVVEGKVIEEICPGEMLFMDGGEPKELREGVNEVRVMCNKCFQQGFMILVGEKK